MPITVVCPNLYCGKSSTFDDADAGRSVLCPHGCGFSFVVPLPPPGGRIDYCCPHCGRRQSAADGDEGKTVSCSRCKKPVIVPKCEPKEGLPVPPNVLFGLDPEERAKKDKEFVNGVGIFMAVVGCILLLALVLSAVGDAMKAIGTLLK